MVKKLLWVMAGLLIVASVVLAACTTPTPEVIKVVETVEKIVEKEGEKVTVVETKEVVVTATPEPVKAVEFKSADPNTLVVVSIGENIDTLDPAWNYESDGDAVILNVYDQLVTYKGTSATEFVPALATGWEVKDGGKTYVFNIRKGVKFHDGADMTPADVAYSIQRGVLQGGGDSPQWLFTEPFFGIGTYDVAELVDPEGGLDDDAEALKAADPALLAAACQKVMDAIQYDEAAGTVTFNLATPWGPFLATLAQSWGSVVDKDWAIANGAWDGDCANWQNYYGVTSETTPLRDKVNGTGPYMLESWTPGEQKVLVMNPNWWRTEPVAPGFPVKPSIERIVLKGVSEWGTRFAMMQAGDADNVAVPRGNISQVDPLVGELCVYNLDTAAYDCAPTDKPDAPLRLYKGEPSTSRTDIFMTHNLKVEGGNPYVGSGQLDGNGIPADFFSDIHMRKAFNYCFDWNAYIADALAGEAVQVSGYLIPGMIGYQNDGPKYAFDMEKCKEELQLAWDGQVWEKGFRLQVAYNTGNVTRQTIAQILQNNFATIDAKFRLEIIALPWPTYLAEFRNRRLPVAVSGWIEDLHDPHNWAQPFLIGTYAGRQSISPELKAQFNELVMAGVTETDDAKRAEIYHKLTQMDYDNAIAVRLAVATGRRYEQRWLGGYYPNPIYGPENHYYTWTKK
ncbi:MAG TPA: ABC transporter substrate-binding protein [Anaerolineae bacterium]|nr:ABC transporter substrate-binding protein [Anaerolineae bacterium]HQI86756.1 ABC transporter substrate-binding protein [Anaerolineae bacterium]